MVSGRAPKSRRSPPAFTPPAAQPPSRCASAAKAAKAASIALAATVSDSAVASIATQVPIPKRIRRNDDVPGGERGGTDGNSRAGTGGEGGQVECGISDGYSMAIKNHSHSYLT